MTDGTLAVRRRDPKTSEVVAQEAKQAALASGSYEYFAEMETIFGTGHLKKKGKDLPAVVGAVDEVKIETRRREKLRTFDKHLKQFKYSAALDSGIQKVGPLSLFTHFDGAQSQWHMLTWRSTSNRAYHSHSSRSSSTATDSELRYRAETMFRSNRSSTSC